MTISIGTVNLSFHFFRRVPRPLADDLNPRVGDIGIGFDGKILKGDDPAHRKAQRKNENENAVIQGEIDNPMDHNLAQQFEYY